MAKKKKKVVKKTHSYGIELIGILLILLSVIGLAPNTGIAGEFIRNFAIFLVGTWYGVLLVLVMIAGGFMIVKREKPDFFTSNLIGLYISLIGFLILSHLEYIQKGDLQGFSIVTETFSHFGGSIENTCGGLIGALFSAAFLALFDVSGTNMVTYVLIACGIIMFTGKSIYDIIAFFKDKVKTDNVEHKKDSKLKMTDKDKKDIKAKEEAYEQDNVIIKDIQELIRKDEVVEEPIEEETVEVDYTGYQLPDIDVLNKPSDKNKQTESTEIINHNVDTLRQVMKDFGIEGKVVAINPGPTVTQYEIEAKSGTKVSKILGINREIALALAAKDVRIEAPIPGKSTIGIEIPNKVTSTVCVREILEKIKRTPTNKLAVVLGKDIMGKPMCMEINKTPHLLVAGSTGSGKSVCINSFIVSILMRTKPNEVKLVLIDPKKVEFAMYEDIPHLLTPVVTDPKDANDTLKKVVREMEKRYEMFKQTGTKNIAGYNAYIDKVNSNSEDKKVKMPFIVVIIDELADLMLVAAKEVEDSIMRITQMARAAGIHLIVATQRPSTDVITGVVKANIPTRISFAVASAIDSRTILGMMGAEKLLGKGDMLYLPQDQNTPIRIQGTFITDKEILNVVNAVKKKQDVVYDKSFAEELKKPDSVDGVGGGSGEKYDIIDYVTRQDEISISQIQRHFHVGYNRAATIIDELEEQGVVGPATGSGKKRKVLVQQPKDDE